jgi:hypothetical protein
MVILMALLLQKASHRAHPPSHEASDFANATTDKSADRQRAQRSINNSVIFELFRLVSADTKLAELRSPESRASPHS